MVTSLSADQIDREEYHGGNEANSHYIIYKSKPADPSKALYFLHGTG